MSRLSFTAPMVPTLVTAAPAGSGWLHEIKHGGYRAQLVIEDGGVTGYSRNGKDWSREFGPIVSAAAELPCSSAVIDGEVAVQDDVGVTDFHALRSSIARRPDRLVFFAFDLLHLNGGDLRNDPLEFRRGHLQALLDGAGGRIAFNDDFEGEGADIFAVAEAKGLEGIVSKRKGSTYRGGRSSAWLKTKAFSVGQFDVIGVELTPGGPPSVLLVRQDEDGPEFVGTAFLTLPSAQRDVFWRFVEERATDRSPIPGMRKKGATWVKPGLSGSVRYLRGEGMLRHATLMGLSLAV